MPHLSRPFALLLLALTALARPCAVLAHTLPLDEAIDAACHKEIVLLGELPSHGEARAFEAKAQIVKSLVDRCGFNMVLFEAPVYEFEAMGALGMAKVSSEDLENAIGRFWVTRELTDWRDWLLAGAREGRIQIGGIDDQVGVTSLKTTNALAELVAEANPVPQRAICRETVRRHLEWAYTPERTFDAAEKARMVACADRAAESSTAADAESAEAAMARAFDRYALREQATGARRSRDDSMYESIRWHLRRMAGGSRAVIWTSTVHAAREPGGRAYEPFGHLLAHEFGDRLFTMGFTALAGSSAVAGGPVRALEPAADGSLETRALNDGADARYLGGAALEELTGAPSRLYGNFSVHPWARHFDAVLVFREEVAPTFAAPPR